MAASLNPAILTYFSRHKHGVLDTGPTRLRRLWWRPRSCILKSLLLKCKYPLKLTFIIYRNSLFSHWNVNSFLLYFISFCFNLCMYGGRAPKGEICTKVCMSVWLLLWRGSREDLFLWLVALFLVTRGSHIGSRLPGCFRYGRDSSWGSL